MHEYRLITLTKIEVARLLGVKDGIVTDIHEKNENFNFTVKQPLQKKGDNNE